MAASSAVAKPVFETEEWTDWTKVAALISFGAAVFAVASAAVLAVGWVLRPGRGSNTKNFFGETVVNLWLGGHSKDLVCADEDRLNLLFADRCLRTLPAWHFRNRRKARWLRRSWMFLAIGIVFIAAAGIFVLARTIEVADPEADGLAANIQWWQIPAVIAGFAVLSLVSIYRDWLRAGRREKKWNSDEQKRAEAARAAEAAKAAKGAVETSEALEREVREIAEKLPVSPTLSNKQIWV